MCKNDALSTSTQTNREKLIWQCELFVSILSALFQTFCCHWYQGLRLHSLKRTHSPGCVSHLNKGLFEQKQPKRVLSNKVTDESRRTIQIFVYIRSPAVLLLNQVATDPFQAPTLKSQSRDCRVETSYRCLQDRLASLPCAGVANYMNAYSRTRGRGQETA